MFNNFIREFLTTISEQDSFEIGILLQCWYRPSSAESRFAGSPIGHAFDACDVCHITVRSLRVFARNDTLPSRSRAFWTYC